MYKLCFYFFLDTSAFVAFWSHFKPRCSSSFCSMEADSIPAYLLQGQKKNITELKDCSTLE